MAHDSPAGNTIIHYPWATFMHVGVFISFFPIYSTQGVEWLTRLKHAGESTLLNKSPVQAKVAGLCKAPKWLTCNNPSRQIRLSGAAPQRTEYKCMLQCSYSVVARVFPKVPLGCFSRLPFFMHQTCQSIFCAKKPKKKPKNTHPHTIIIMKLLNSGWIQLTS